MSTIHTAFSEYIKQVLLKPINPLLTPPALRWQYEPCVMDGGSDGQHLLVRQCVALAGLMVLVWDFVISIDDEYRLLWKVPPFPTKIIYFLLRYVPISVQILGVYAVFGPLSKPPISTDDCFMWFNIEMTFAQITITLTSVILFLRVYALYGKHFKIGLFLLTLFSFDNLQSATMCMRAQTRLTFDGKCTAHDNTSDPYIYATSVITTQGIIWWLSWRKRALAKELGIPLIRAAIRDGAWTFAGIAVVIAVVIPYVSLVESVAEIQLLLIMIIHSIVGCRIIINMQKVVCKQPPTPEILDFDSELAMHTTPTTNEE